MRHSSSRSSEILDNVGNDHASYRSATMSSSSATGPSASLNASTTLVIALPGCGLETTTLQAASQCSLRSCARASRTNSSDAFGKPAFILVSLMSGRANSGTIAFCEAMRARITLPSTILWLQRWVARFARAMPLTLFSKSRTESTDTPLRNAVRTWSACADEHPGNQESSAMSLGRGAIRVRRASRTLSSEAAASRILTSTA